jgi:hypothetical protein
MVKITMANDEANNSGLTQIALEQEIVHKDNDDKLNTNRRATSFLDEISTHVLDVKKKDTGKLTPAGVIESTRKDWLWTGESPHCICTHHVEQHCTVRDQCDHVITIHCHGTYADSVSCNCRLFRPHSIRIDSFYFNSNDNGILTED